ncbi:MAG: hypothetical protein HY360_14870 [Verrucomicrobia bacterium]|nr:hypothetical protein [Verrucomicrobiota bacterium]
MHIAYPKHPREIRIRISVQDMDNGLVMGIASSTDVMLSEKLSDYLVRLGYTNMHITGIVCQLLTKGKVRVYFRDYVERIELMPPVQKFSSAQAMSLLEDFVAEIHGGETETEESKRTTTQKIIVQPPKAVSWSA